MRLKGHLWLNHSSTRVFHSGHEPLQAVTGDLIVFVEVGGRKINIIEEYARISYPVPSGYLQIVTEVLVGARMSVACLDNNQEHVVPSWR